MPDSADPVSGPADHDKALSVAYLRMLDATQPEAAAAAGCSERTVRNWEASSWWPEIQREAEEKWLSGIVAQARKLFEDEMDLSHAFKVLERRVPGLAPPTTTSNLNLRTPEGVQVAVTRKVVQADPGNRLTRYVTQDSGTNGAGKP